MNKKTVTLIVIILGAIMALLSDFMSEEKNISPVLNEVLKVSFIDVGQGDSTLLELPNGEIMLIDAGNPEDGERIVEMIEEKGYKKVDYLIATHPHSDHIGGMAEVVKAFEISKVYMPKKSHSTSSFEKLVDAIYKKNLKITEAKTGVTLIDEENLKIEILAPGYSDYDNLNNFSAVVKVDYGETTFIFTGDAEKEVEYEMLDSGADLKADVLKIGHHGSSTSSAYGFIKAVNPKYGVISCGAGNDYGHPHSEVLELLKKNSIETLRTDELGTIVITSDGINLSIEKSE